MVRMILYLVLFPVFIMLMVFFLLAIPLPGDTPLPFTAGRNLPVALVTAGLGGVYLIGLIRLIGTALGSTGRAIDRILSPHGFILLRQGISGWQFQGPADGQQVQIRYQPAYGVRSQLLDITVESGHDLSIAIGWKRPILESRAYQEHDLNLPDSPAYRIFSASGSSAAAILHRKKIQDALVRILGKTPPVSTREIYLKHGTVQLRIRSLTIPLDALVQWIDDLRIIAYEAKDIRLPS